MQREVYIDADLETSTLEIKTESSLGSDEKIEVRFYTSYLSHVGGVILHFTSIPRYQLQYCTFRTNFSTELPTDTNKVWRISLTRTSGIRLVIHCNEVEVLDLLMSESTCSDFKWSIHWSRDVEKIYFSSLDTASDYYRLRGRGRYLLTCI